jgi:carboxyl-terminal processing protease
MSLLLPALLFLANEPTDVELALRRMAQVFAAVEREAAEPVDPNHAFYDGALPALLRQLDPHSVFFTPGQFQQLREMERSTTKGFGTVVSILPGRVIVLQTLPGTPSTRAGLAPGDEIVAVNNIRLDFLTPEQLIGLLSESRRSEAQLLVRRPGNARLLPFKLTPEDMESPSVDRAFLLEPGIAYVRIASFEGETGKQLRQALESLGGESLKGLVLDLRNNPGGLLTAAVDCAALFLEPGSTVMSTRGRAKSNEDSKTPASSQPYRFPLVVLVNGKSASASEILAGAVQDHRRGKVVGERTYGKGLVQSIYPLSEGTGMALTTAFYFTPAGRLIQRPLSEGQIATSGEGGLQPDIPAAPEGVSRLRAYLDVTASFTSFATGFVQRTRRIAEDFEVSNAILDEFQRFLSARNVLPGVNEWSADREWIRSRLRQEIFNLSLGVAKGDEVEMARDPQVRRARLELP